MDQLHDAKRMLLYWKEDTYLYDHCLMGPLNYFKHIILFNNTMGTFCKYYRHICIFVCLFFVFFSSNIPWI